MVALQVAGCGEVCVWRHMELLCVSMTVVKFSTLGCIRLLLVWMDSVLERVMQKDGEVEYCVHEWCLQCLLLVSSPA